jgi:hypothetical protein
MRSIVPALGLPAVVVLVVACSGAGVPAASPAEVAIVDAAATTPATSMPSDAPPATPLPVRTPTNLTPLSAPAASARPAPTPWPETDGQGPEVVGGRDLLVDLTRNYTSETVNGVTRIRDGLITQTSEMNDPRVDGTVTFDINIDVYDKVGSQWATMRVVNDAGAWEGPCSGAAWDGGEGIAWSCWLTGTGAYTGWTYYRQLTKDLEETVMRATGAIYPGGVPAP